MFTYGYIHVISILSTNGNTAYLVVECCCLFVYLFICLYVSRYSEQQKTSPIHSRQSRQLPDTTGGIDRAKKRGTRSEEAADREQETGTGVDETEGGRRKERQRRRQKGETDDDEILYGTHE